MSVTRVKRENRRRGWLTDTEILSKKRWKVVHWISHPGGLETLACVFLVEINNWVEESKSQAEVG